MVLPVEYERNFSLHLYFVSHGLLLLRSGKDEKHSTRIDILFQDVRWMALPVWFEGIRIERGKLSDLVLPLTAKIKEEAHFMSVFKVISQGVTHWVLASQRLSVAEDKGNYGDNSSLLPNLDFRGFVAPLRKQALVAEVTRETERIL